MSEEATHHHPNYTKIYFWLLGLLAVSVIGPMAEIRELTLITAFGIALVKAYLVVVNFMHLTLAPRFVTYLMGTTLIFVFLFFAAVSPDIMKPVGSNWVKTETWNPPVTAEAHGAHH